MTFKTRQATRSNDSERFLNSFWGGLLIAGLMGLAGVAIALIRAPQSGKKTRKQLRGMANDLQDEVEKIVTDAQSRLEEMSEQIAEGREGFQSQTNTAVKDARKAVKKAQKQAEKTVKEWS